MNPHVPITQLQGEQHMVSLVSSVPAISLHTSLTWNDLRASYNFSYTYFSMYIKKKKNRNPQYHYDT